MAAATDLKADVSRVKDKGLLLETFVSVTVVKVHGILLTLDNYFRFS